MPHIDFNKILKAVALGDKGRDGAVIVAIMLIGFAMFEAGVDQFLMAGLVIVAIGAYMVRRERHERYELATQRQRLERLDRRGVAVRKPKRRQRTTEQGPDRHGPDD